MKIRISPNPKSIPVFLLVFLIAFVSCKIDREPGKSWNLREKITRLSMDLVGIPYQYGGYDITGFDCSGFVYYVYSSFGIELPRTAKMQGRLKKKITLKKARPGDVLIFKLKRGWHSGIYSGRSIFIHAPNQRLRVCKENLNAYWLSRLKAVIQTLDD